VTTTPSFRDELPALAEALEGKEPEEILGAIAPRFPRWIALANSFGAEDCLLVDVIARARLGIEVFTLDTGYLFPETYALWKRLEERYRITIRAVRPAAADVAGAPLHPWERDPDACCDVRKVRPLRAALADLGAWVTGIRRDQTPDRVNAKVVEWDGRFGLVKVNPLAAWKSEDVRAYVKRFGVPTNPLHERGYASIGCAPCTTPVKLGEDPRAGRWRGREKTECGLHHLRTGGRGEAAPPGPPLAPGQPHPAAPPLARSRGGS
jgi:phosphoadenylyl-sulfate reductase (thioredoxin)